MFANRFTLSTVAALGLSFILGDAAIAQAPVPTVPKIVPPPARVNDPSGIMHLDVEVTTTKGKPAEPMTAQDITLLDNKTPSPITSFTAINGASTPVEVTIVVDAVNTPYTFLGYQRDQIAKYLRSDDGKLPYPTTFVVLTDTGFNLYSTPSTNGNGLAQALDKAKIGLRDITRAQGIYGADDQLTLSIKALSQLLDMESKKPGRKLILWVSPGWPLISGPNIELDHRQQEEIYRSAIALTAQMRQNDITLYSINSWGVTEDLARLNYYQTFLNGLKRPSDAQLGSLGLQVLATQSGGLVLNSSDVIGMMKQCVADADHYYRITFQPAPAEKPNEYHDLKLKVSADGLVARTQQGYYAQP